MRVCVCVCVCECVCVCGRACVVRALACCCLDCSLCLHIIHFFRVWEVAKKKKANGGRKRDGGAPQNMRPKQGGRIGNGAGAQPAPEKEKKKSQKSPRIREACKKTAQTCRRPACVQSICVCCLIRVRML